MPAQHFSGRGLTDRNRRLWAGWVVEGPTRRFYHAGDTGYFGGFVEIGKRFGPIEVVRAHPRYGDGSNPSRTQTSPPWGW